MNIKSFIKNHLVYTAMFPICNIIAKRKSNTASLTILKNQSTIKDIVTNGKSLCRFGDGEFSCIVDPDYNIGFQVNSHQMRLDLIDALNSNDDNLLVGILGVFDCHNLKNVNFNAKKYWVYFIYKYFDKLYPYLKSNKRYADSLITRFYIDIKNKQSSADMFKNLKSIWHNKNILIIEGADAKVGVGNDLFSNAKSIERIICPQKNAYEKIDKIYSSALKYGKQKLIILSLGPTATILAHRISKIAGYQAVDLGHIDTEYEWMCMGAKKKKKISGKFVNEISDKPLYKYSIGKTGNIDSYSNQIVKVIK